METVFKNRWFYRLLIIYIFLILIWNTYMVISGNYLGLIAVVIELALLYLLFNKHRLAKMAIHFWAIIMMVGPGLSIIGKLIKMATGDDLNFMVDSLVQNLLLFTFGLLIYYFNKKTVFIQEREVN
ncbi:hypothetical protein APR41_14590 [Salegentibacter salinarum]|uniref:Uncharacterized protein n=1 Tax=Salegentibacter salinarum TaxID=447422 RepID=A0A2N0TZP4_9FLAO|nr:hypothetical protein [Salegentibacter salinarum]PKD20207.1 hypothetical protein APR41_14590 [Salegentibacter salinarum]SKB87187.1 hypothetical protein SAMN05660903_02970 [Salegentibacter salinarum]